VRTCDVSCANEIPIGCFALRCVVLACGQSRAGVSTFQNWTDVSSGVVNEKWVSESLEVRVFPFCPRVLCKRCQRRSTYRFTCLSACILVANSRLFEPECQTNTSALIRSANSQASDLSVRNNKTHLSFRPKGRKERYEPVILIKSRKKSRTPEPPMLLTDSFARCYVPEKMMPRTAIGRSTFFAP